LHKASALSRREQLADAAGRAEAHGPPRTLIGSGKQQLVPRWQPKGTGGEPRGAAERPAAARAAAAPFSPRSTVRYRTSDKT